MKIIERYPDLSVIIPNIGGLALHKILRIRLGILLVTIAARYFDSILLHWHLLRFLMLLISFGLPSVVVRNIVRDPGSLHITLGTSATFHLLFGVIAFVSMLDFIVFMRPDDALVSHW